MIEKLKKLAYAGYITDVTLFRALNENSDLEININDYITQVGINIDEILGEVVEEPEVEPTKEPAKEPEEEPTKEPEVEPTKEPEVEPEELPTVDTGDDEE
jgi:hypothetical protein